VSRSKTLEIVKLRERVGSLILALSLFFAMCESRIKVQKYLDCSNVGNDIRERDRECGEGLIESFNT